MKEMTPAERVSLNALRATALAKMSDADFANLETEVANKGLRNLDGWFASEVAKAVEQVLKHPGHANQGAHGGKGGASTPAGKTPAGKKQQASRASDVAQQAVDNANLNVPATAPKAARFRANEARASHAKARQTDDPQQKAYHLKAASEHAKRASQLMEDENFHDAAEAWGNASKALATASAFNGSVGKSVEPVAKHPGHANQASHGGKGGGGSTSAPASSGGASSSQRQDEAADKVGMGANQAAENMGGHANEMQQEIYGKDRPANVSLRGEKMTPIDEVELMGINDSLISAAESLTLLSSSKAQGQYDQIINVRRQLKETRSDAVRHLSPVVRNIAVRTIDKHVAEVDDLLSLHREAWTGVGGTFE
jgi:hypothetical protein